MNHRWVQIAIGVVFLSVAILSMVNTYQFNSYVRETLKRDNAQDECLVDQAAWLQDWLHWRWQENIEATREQILQYQLDHPQPPCQIKR